MRRYQLVSVLAFAMVAGPANAQTVRTASAGNDTVLSRLESLSHLPDAQWRYHVGDMPHGESADDSGWQVAHPDELFSTEAVWLRSRIEVPKTLQGYDLTAARVWLHLRVESRTPVILYFNGRRVALGSDLEPVVLFDQAKPEDTVLVAVKLLATTGAKSFSGAALKIDFAPERPSPEVVRQEVLSAQRLLPSLDSKDPNALNTVEQAESQVDLAALQAGDQQRFDRSLRQADETLQPLKSVLQTADFHLTGNSHIDAAWLWPWTETVDVVQRTFGSALQLMNEYPNYTYTQSAAVYNDWMAKKYPQLDHEIQRRIKDGRWEIVGGMWVEPDLNMPDGESTVRSLLIGKQWYRDHYGVDVRIGWNPDSFGYNWQLPQIYKKSGIDYFVTQKMAWNDTNQLPLKLFWWESPDGSKVLTYFPKGYANRDLSPSRLAADFAAARKAVPSLPEMMDLYGVGDHGGGATRAMLDEGQSWMDRDYALPKMEFGTARSFFASVEPQITGDSPVWDYKRIAGGFTAPKEQCAGEIAIPTWNDELYLEYHRGVYTTQAEMKRNLRKAPEAALDAEKYASLAWLEGEPYPAAELTAAWKTIAFNEFHDLAAGSGVKAIYQDAAQEFSGAHRTTEQIRSLSIKRIVSDIDTNAPKGETASNTAPVLVLNPLGWPRSGVTTAEVQLPAPASAVHVEDAEGRPVPSEVEWSDAATHRFRLRIAARNVPPMGYEVLHIVQGDRKFTSDVRASGTTIENTLLRVRVNPATGCIESLYEKQSGYDALAAGSCGNQLQAFSDTPKTYDAWNIDPGTLDRAPLAMAPEVSVKLVESGPLRAVIEVKRSLHKSVFVQRLILYSGSDQLVVENDIDWSETHVLLKAAFALAASGPEATYEIPYGTINRPTTRNNSWEKARFEVPALRWADLGDGRHGFSLINDSKYGYDAVGDTLRLSLLRSPTSPDPDADRGHHHFAYALYPHAGDWREAMTVRHGYEFNEPLQALAVSAHAGPMAAVHSFISLQGDNVVLTALKKSEDGDALIFRFYEWKGESGTVTLQVPRGAQRAVETNLLEQEQGGELTLKGDHVEVTVHPYEIVTVRVDYARR